MQHEEEPTHSPAGSRADHREWAGFASHRWNTRERAYTMTGTPLMSTSLKWFVEEGARAITERDWQAYGALFSEDLEMRAPGIPGTVTGRHIRVAMVQGIMDAFPDGQVEVERAFGQDDLGCLQVRFAGTHTGPLAGSGGAEIPPTGKRVEFLYCIVVRFEEGIAVEVDEYYDQLDLLAQIGISV